MAFPTPEELSTIVDPMITARGMDLERLSAHRAGAKSAIVIAVDSDTHPDLDQLEELSQVIGAEFDRREEEGDLSFGAGYTLEVTTPGVDAPLTLPRHWRRNRGRAVRVTFEDGSTLAGRIGPLNEEGTSVIVIEKIKKDLTYHQLDISVSSFVRAVVDIEFSKPPADEVHAAEQAYDNLIAQQKEQ